MPARPKPPEKRRADGADRGRIVPVRPLDALPDPPPGLNEAGRDAWDLVGSQLVAARSLTPAHLPQLAAFAQAIHIREAAFARIVDDGYVKASARAKSDGNTLSPHFRAWEAAAQKAITLGELLGASPTALARLGLTLLKTESLAESLEGTLGKGRSRR